MIAPADLFHSLLAWGLSVFNAGHIMALLHRLALNDETVGGMTGRLGRGTIEE
jgi:cytochrome b561